MSQNINTVDIESNFGDDDYLLASVGGKLRRIPRSSLPSGGGGGVTSWNDLEDKPFGEETGLFEILPETVLTANADGGYMLPVLGLVNGHEYIVKMNGTTYNVTAFYLMELQATMIGNAGTMGFEDTGEPFLIADMASQGLAVAMPLAAVDEFRLGIDYNGTRVVPLDAKFLPTPPTVFTNYDEYVEGTTIYAYTNLEHTEKVSAYDLNRVFETNGMIMTEGGTFKPTRCVSSLNGSICIEYIDTDGKFVSVMSAEYPEE